jgi:hypothetical protein
LQPHWKIKLVFLKERKHTRAFKEEGDGVVVATISVDGKDNTLEL